jgi:hypothetical protein
VAANSERAALDSRVRGNERRRTSRNSAQPTPPIDTAQAEAERLADMAEKEKFNRSLHTHLGFWHVCEQKRCKRARGCVGEVSACAARHFPHVPEDTKAWLQKAFEGLRNGLSPYEASCAATAHVAALNAALERLDQRMAEAEAARTAARAAAATPPPVERVAPPPSHEHEISLGVAAAPSARTLPSIFARRREGIVRLRPPRP